jgi:hypothetical protein
MAQLFCSADRNSAPAGQEGRLVVLLSVRISSGSFSLERVELLPCAGNQAVEI